jgi:hypothetical protein
MHQNSKHDKVKIRIRIRRDIRQIIGKHKVTHWPWTWKHNSKTSNVHTKDPEL